MAANESARSVAASSQAAVGHPAGVGRPTVTEANGSTFSNAPSAMLQLAAAAAAQKASLHAGADRGRGQTRAQAAFRTALRPLLTRSGAAASAASQSAASGISAASHRGASGQADADDSPRLPALVDLPEGPYMLAGLYLDARSLCQVDVACRMARVLNQSPLGPWRALGCRECHGVELEGDGIFDVLEQLGDMRSSGPSNNLRPWAGAPANARALKVVRVDWKGRYWRFKKELPTFRPPFVGKEITRVRNPDEVAYCRCMLRADVLSKTATTGVYIEIEVMANPDNLSLAVVDFEAGGHSSVTFSPDTGAVIRERKVREVPRKVEGAYIQPLAATLPGRRFEGSVALYLFQGHLAFLRRCTSDAATTHAGRWETTGFVTDLSWAEGRCLTPCLAFRDEGTYQVKIARVGTSPPLPLDIAPTSYDENRWAGLDWEAEAVAV
eukprot:TRINITY_DN16040_c1_g5_i1.p1 TRINITY_DN16040_c1_g5~~TRINITY_DN16040_c1_g5_i1.p1  ORF type:complete len:480 (+),score=69.05 TRINITY_DN16040_c1_g5_i1:120-1442(+)